MIALSSDTGGVLFSYFPVGIDKNSARDQILRSFADGADDFVQVDRGSYDNVSYSLDRASLSGTELGIFTLFIERTSNVFVSLFLAPVSLFQQGLASAQSDIQVEGTGVFAGIQPSGLQDALNASGGSSTTTQPKATMETVEKTPKPKKTATEVATKEDTPTEEVATEEDTPTEEVATDVTPKSKKTTTKEQPTPTEKKTTKKTTTSTDYSELGVVADGEYESPQYGSSVTWDQNWIINESSDNPVLSDTKKGIDRIDFARGESGGPIAKALVSVLIFGANTSDTPESIVDGYTSANDGATILLSDSTKQEGAVVLLSTLDDGTEVIQYFSVFFLDRGKTVVAVSFFATPDSVEGALLDAQDGITVEGDPVLTLFDSTEILDAYNK